MADVFISYKSERRKAARHMAKVLQCYGYSAWYDYGLIPGDDFEPKLMSELSGAQVVLVLWCSAAARSQWVQKEAAAAREQSKYLPAWIEMTELPSQFAGADTIDLTTWDGAPRSHNLDRLLTDIARRVDRHPKSDFFALKELDEDWRGFGAPNLRDFALGEAPPGRREAQAPPSKAPGKWQQGSVVAGSRLSDVITTISEKDLPAKAKTLLHQAAAGDPNAINMLGVFFAEGRNNIKQDIEMACKLWSIASGAGHERASYNLALYASMIKD